MYPGAYSLSSGCEEIQLHRAGVAKSPGMTEDIERSHITTVLLTDTYHATMYMGSHVCP